jgi:hypothetical protein
VTRRGVCAIALLMASGCAAEPRSGQVPALQPSAVAREPAQSKLPVLEPGAPDEPTPLASDLLWQRAAAGDPIDLQRLADREGATGLLAGVAAGRSIGLTALSALPYAEDGELALDRLCSLALRVTGGGRRALLVAIHGVIAAIPPDRERLAAEMLRACAGQLGQLATDPGLARADRDLAQSARTALEHLIGPEPPP